MVDCVGETQAAGFPAENRLFLSPVISQGWTTGNNEGLTVRSSQVAQNYKVYKSDPEGSTIWIAYESHYHSHVIQLMKSRE